MKKPAALHGENHYLGWIFIAFIFICLFFLLYFFKNDKEVSQEPPKDIRVDAVNACRGFVTRKLKAPWTAKFPAPSQAVVSKSGDDQYIVKSYVEAQDWSGNIQRQNYECVVRYEQEKNRWFLMNFSLGSNEVKKH